MQNYSEGSSEGSSELPAELSLGPEIGSSGLLLKKLEVLPVDNS